MAFEDILVQVLPFGFVKARAKIVNAFDRTIGVVAVQYYSEFRVCGIANSVPVFLFSFSIKYADRSGDSFSMF